MQFIRCLIVLLVISYTCSAQDFSFIESDPLFESWRWKSFPELSDKAIRCFAEGKDHSMWFGAGKGIYHYDGIRWQHYYEENDIIKAPVYGLCYTRSNILYAISPKGVCHFEQGQWLTDMKFPSEGVLGSEWEVLHIIETEKGEIWAGVYFGLIRINKDKIIVYSTLDQIKSIKETIKNVTIIDVTGIYKDLNSLIVFYILEDRNNNLWLAMEDGTTLYIQSKTHNIQSPEKYIVFSEKDGMNISRLPVLFESSEGDIYNISQSVAGSVNRYSIQDEKWSYIQLSEQFGGDNLNFSICETSDDRLWIGGLSRFFTCKDGVWREYKQPEIEVPQTRIILHETQDGCLWIVGHLGDVLRIEYQTPLWKTYKGLLYQCESPDGLEWYLQGDGKVVTYNPATGEWIKLGKEFPMSDPTSVFIDDSGIKWAIGSHGDFAALAYYYNDQWNLKLFPEVCWSFHSNGVIQTKDHSIWFGANADCGDLKWGIVKYTPSLGNPTVERAWKYYPGTEVCEVAYALGVTDNNTLLCGYFKGLFEYDGKISRNLQEVLQTDIIKVEFMAQDPDSGVWIASRSQGVIHYITDKRWKKYTSEDGLASNSVASITISQDSAVWVATDKGISRFDGKGWTRKALPDFFRMGRGTGYIRQGKDGSIWICKASPEWFRRAFFKKTFTAENSPLISYRIRPEKLPPETEITKYDAKVFFPGNAMIFWTGFDMWNQTEQDALQFSFCIDNGTWSDFTSEKSHTFLNLSRGHHTLKVRARDKFLNIDPTPAEITFRVVPPIWGQIWFIALMGGILIALIYLFITTTRKNRIMESQNQVMKQKNEDLIRQQNEIEIKGKQIFELLEKERENSWFNEGIIRVNEIIKKNKDNIEKLSHDLLLDLIEYLEANSAGMFLFRKAEDLLKDEDHLELISSVIYNKQRLEKKKYMLEEGLVGACFKENKTMFYSNIPETYFIDSGLGKSKLTCLLLLPLKLHDEVTGVLEISSFKTIGEKQIQWLEFIAENIASSIINLDSKTKIEKMYMKSQEQSAGMEEQEEELQQQMEELQATQEESQRREKELLNTIEEYKENITDLKSEKRQSKKTNKK